jgi:hypothetical protein
MIVVETLGSRYAISAKWTSEMGQDHISDGYRTTSALIPIVLQTSKMVLSKFFAKRATKR